MSLTREDVAKIAHLARLDLSDEALATYQEQLSAVLQYAEMLNELDLEGVPPTSHAVAQENVMRDDEIRPSLSIEDVFANATKQQQNQFWIQTVLDEA
ncbi:MAG: Asp-tRNA(Asn)/Glu-tRNA(Gln) amidotransferase subunit GatC [Chloroflexota bacterium]